MVPDDKVGVGIEKLISACEITFAALNGGIAVDVSEKDRATQQAILSTLRRVAALERVAAIAQALVPTMEFRLVSTVELRDALAALKGGTPSTSPPPASPSGS